MKYRDYEESSVLRDTWKAITFQREQIALGRSLLRKSFPVLDALDAGSVKIGRTTDAQLYANIVAALDRARKAQAEVKKRIESGDMPLYKLDPIVNAALASFSITESSKADFSLAVLEWLAEERKREWAIKLGSAVLGIGLAAACFIPGIGVGAVIALGAIGAGIGGAAAYYEFEMADDLHQAGESGRAGSHQLISDPDAAKKEYLWGIVNLILAGVDIFMAGGEVFRLGKVLSRFDSVKDGLSFVDKVGDVKKSIKFLNKIEDTENGAILLKKLESASEEALKQIERCLETVDATDVDGLLLGFNKIDDTERAAVVLSSFEEIGKINEFSRIAQQLSKSNANRLFTDALEIGNQELSNIVEFFKHFDDAEDAMGAYTKFADVHHFTEFLDIEDIEKVVNGYKINRHHPAWMQTMQEGNVFNRAQSYRYKNNEVYIYKKPSDPKAGYYRVDSCDVDEGLIVSRKFTQFDQVGETTIKHYVDELVDKYKDGSVIANVPSQVSGSGHKNAGLAGKELWGKLVLEVPVQNQPAARWILEYAKSKRVEIWDIKGVLYK